MREEKAIEKSRKRVASPATTRKSGGRRRAQHEAETRTEQAETRTEQAETRTEQAETRTEQANTRTEEAEARTEEAETRSEAQGEEAIRASELSYRRLFEAAKDGILILDADTGLISDVNPFLTELLGFSHDELVGQTIWELGPFKDIESNKIKFDQLQRKGIRPLRKPAAGNQRRPHDHRGIRHQRVSSR